MVLLKIISFYISLARCALPRNELVIQSSPASPTISAIHSMSSNHLDGTAESLISGVFIAEGLGKYCDSNFVNSTKQEMQEALQMRTEEMNLAARNMLSNSSIMKGISTILQDDHPTSDALNVQTYNVLKYVPDTFKMVTHSGFSNSTPTLPLSISANTNELQLFSKHQKNIREI